MEGISCVYVIVSTDLEEKPERAVAVEVHATFESAQRSLLEDEMCQSMPGAFESMKVRLADWNDLWADEELFRFDNWLVRLSKEDVKNLAGTPRKQRPRSKGPPTGTVKGGSSASKSGFARLTVGSDEDSD